MWGQLLCPCERQEGAWSHRAEARAQCGGPFPNVGLLKYRRQKRVSPGGAPQRPSPLRAAWRQMGWQVAFLQLSGKPQEEGDQAPKPLSVCPAAAAALLSCFPPDNCVSSFSIFTDRFLRVLRHMPNSDCSARSLNPRSGKKTPRDNATCNRGIYYWLEPGPPALTKGVRTKRPRAPGLSDIYWVQLFVGASGLVTQLQGNFCWPNPSWAFSFPLIGSLSLARHMSIGWLQVAW